MQPEHPLVGELMSDPVKPVNRQKFENSKLRGSVEDQRDSQSFAGDKDPNLAILTEKPEHRVIMFLRAQGKSAQEVAKVTGFSYQWILQVCRQPWFKKRLIETIREAGQDEVELFVKGEILPSLMTLAEIRDDPESKDSTRVAACNSILDRGLGKSVQHIKTEQIKSPDQAHEEMNGIERELEAIRMAQSSVGLLPPQSN